MIAFLSSLLGFFSAGLPQLVQLYRTRQDHAHELAMLQLHAQLAAAEAQTKREAIMAASEASQLAAQIALARSDIERRTGIGFIDGLNGSVRPVIAYAFFGLYALMKLLGWHSGDPAASLWGEEDQAIFAGIISFYYGQRAFTRGSK